MSDSDSNNTIQFSFIIPTYNRINLVCKAIDSAVAFIRNDLRYEIIVIDDASTDETFERLTEKYFNEIASGLLKIIKLGHNSGVVSARNNGAKIALGRWLLILDSDNEIISGKKDEFESVLLETNHPFVLFRCIDDSGSLIGKDNIEQVLDYESALNKNFPEFFGVCDKDTFLSEYTKSDVVALKRFEAIAYFRILKRNRFFGISNLVMRRYSFIAPDRLSSSKGVVKDAYFLMLGHYIFLKENWGAMSIKRICVSLGALIYYTWIHLLSSFSSLLGRHL